MTVNLQSSIWAGGQVGAGEKELLGHDTPGTSCVSDNTDGYPLFPYLVSFKVNHKLSFIFRLSIRSGTGMSWGMGGGGG